MVEMVKILWNFVKAKNFNILVFSLNSRYYSKYPKSILYFGSDEFSLCSLKALMKKQQKGHVKKIEVVTLPLKKPYPAVPKFCLKNGINVYEWSIDEIPTDFEIGVVVSFGVLIPKETIESFSLGMLNVHGSLLPRWRGSCPVIHSILNRDQSTGITIMKIKPHKFDVGEIVYQAEMPIPAKIKSREMTAQLAELGAKGLVKVLADLSSFPPISQPAEGITNAPKIKREHSKINWFSMSPTLIGSMYLAFDDYFPLWSTWQGIEVKLRDMVLRENFDLNCTCNDDNCNCNDNNCNFNDKYNLEENKDNFNLRENIDSNDCKGSLSGNNNDNRKHGDLKSQPVDEFNKPNFVPVHKILKEIPTVEHVKSENDIEKSIRENTFRIPGQIEYNKDSNTLRIICKSGEDIYLNTTDNSHTSSSNPCDKHSTLQRSYVEFKTVRVKGKKQMSAVDFYNGYISKVAFKKKFFY